MWQCGRSLPFRNRVFGKNSVPFSRSIFLGFAVVRPVLAERSRSNTILGGKMLTSEVPKEHCAISTPTNEGRSIVAEREASDIGCMAPERVLVLSGGDTP